MAILKLGSKGPEVVELQKLLNNHVQVPYALLIENGNFDHLTQDAVIRFQKNYKKRYLKPDGIAGSKTMAALKGKDPDSVDLGDGWPDRPAFSAMSFQKKLDTFGKFEFEEDATAKDKDAIKILGDWKAKNIITVKIPQLGLIQRPSSGNARSKGKTTPPKTYSTNVSVHFKASKQIVATWAAWEAAGLLDRVISYHGLFVPRYMRKVVHNGKPEKLSNHSWGTAFDINADDNGLGKVPAGLNEEGCVRELVKIANDNGLFWGGHFGGGRMDGMHFEIGIVM